MALALLTGAMFIGCTVKADDAVKTLPPAIYQQMKHGKQLEKVWVGTDYDKTKGFKVSAVEYKAEIRNGTVMDYMPKALATLEKSDSPVTLQVIITKVTTKSFTGFGNAMGKVFVEGKISDATGKIMAAFTTSGSAGSWGGVNDDFQLACDKIASEIAADLLANLNNGSKAVVPIMSPTATTNSINSEVLTNDSIVKLVKADMPEEIVVDMIKNQPTRFDVSVDGVLLLKTNGVSEKIIHEMVLCGKGGSVTPPASPSGSVKLNDGAEAVVPMMPATASTNVISDPAVEKLCESLEQDNPGKVIDALKKLRNMKATEAAPRILPCLAHSNPDVVREACRTLVVIGNQDAVPAIIPLLTNEKPDIIREACRTIAIIGNKDAIPAIEPLLTNSRSDIRDEAYKAITKLRAEP